MTCHFVFNSALYQNDLKLFKYSRIFFKTLQQNITHAKSPNWLKSNLNG
jgi:hypothetical protein